ncbi:hypothetical protein GCM10025867_04420 [Frondihabitans sucicola]|uniref:Bacterial Ig-like domain-containing protein n=1 Tax=Frondihabitans sucicola TaxID=1268041 RepID=A0ABN6XTR9_9MICO|nr:hypothetical protein [Frondihabitans sucicola]BDZ48201.1 hypothetical protein GCM10025867_04420 [Frondihabitans sucicola]
MTLDDKEHKLVVTQVSKGNNTTTAKVTLNAGETGVTQPFQLTTPKDGATIVSPDNSVEFTGLGTTGSTVEIMNTYNSRVVASSTVGSDGTWKSSGVLGFGEQKLRAKVTLPGNGIENTYFAVTVKAAEGVTQPFEVSSPSHNSTVVAPTNLVDFAGKGTTDSTVEIINTYNGRVVATTKVADNGTWKVTGGVGFGVQNLKAVTTLPSGSQSELPLTITVNATQGVSKPFALTTPKNGDTVIAPNNEVTFSGEGTTGAKVEIWTVNGGASRVVAAATVGENGTWTTGKGFLSHQGYNLQARYSINGGQPTLTPFSITVKASANVIQPFALTNPRDGDTVVTPNGMVTFKGVGAAGAKVEIINDLGGAFERVVASGTVQTDGTWSATGGLNPNQTYPLWYSHTPGANGGAQADGTFTITTTPTK